MIRNFLHSGGFWLASSFFVLIAIIAMVSGGSNAVFLIVLIGLTLYAPPLRAWTDRRLNFRLNGWRLVPLFLIMLLVSFFLIGSGAAEVAELAAEKEKQVQAAAAAEKEKQYFLANKAKVLQDMTALRAKDDFDGAIKLGDQYLAVIQDNDLIAAKNASIEAQLAWKVKNQPTLSPSERVAAYDKLVKLNPGNKEYQEGAIKAAALKKNEEKQLAVERAVEQKREARRTMLEKQFSKWDGSHRQVVAAVKKTMKNPSSYEHVETRFADLGKGMRIHMVFRGTNSFGGVVPNSVVALVDDEGNVLSLEQQ